EFDNRYVGRLVLDHTDLWLGPESGPRMVTYAPADDVTRRRLEALHARALERDPVAQE
ncbi:DNA-binding protein, partial [Streptomyces sp. TRM76130]|nr:DNA-binding protein [Streptomyces sp. TRM76130]